MTEGGLMTKLANVPLAKPGFDALNMSAPVLVQMNPQGRWENTKPANLDEDRLKAVVQHLVNSNAVSAAQSYCSHCSAANQKSGGKSNYVPVIMMPIYAADECPFDVQCEMRKMKESEVKPSKGKAINYQKDTDKDREKEKDKKKSKKRGFVMQRLTDFDLLSQW